MCPQKLFERIKVKQKSLNVHFAEVNHNGGDDWVVILTHQTDNGEGIRSQTFLATGVGHFFKLMNLMSVKRFFFDS